MKVFTLCRFIWKPNNNEVTNPTYDADIVNIAAVKRNKIFEHESQNDSTSHKSNSDNPTSNRKVMSMSFNEVHYDSLTTCKKSRLQQEGDRNGEYYTLCRENTEVRGYEVPICTGKK